MSSEPSVAVRRLSKSYEIGIERNGLLTETIKRRLRHPGSGGRQAFEALRDVDLDVWPGDVLGVVGRNGAGKSTLLKVMSRITEPTAGEVVARGRMGSLLEVGTGFHPELTGRENVFLNGAILGMPKRQIVRRFDEIVEFAGVERFLDTPVKRYSSGMYVRLAFAVAAHLEPDILVIDEVLAVGDVAFQKKCLGKLRSAADDSGRTVIFVSHSVAAIQQLCSRVAVLDQGRLVQDGTVDDGIRRYVQLQERAADAPGVFSLSSRTNDHDPDGRRYLSRVVVEGEDGPDAVLRTARPAAFTIEFSEIPPGTWTRFHVRNELDQVVVASDTRMQELPAGDGNTLRFELASLPLLPGRYFLDLAVGSLTSRALVDHLEGAAAFDVVASDLYGPDYEPNAFDGAIYLPPAWRRTGAPAPEPAPNAQLPATRRE